MLFVEYALKNNKKNEGRILRNIFSSSLEADLKHFVKFPKSILIPRKQIYLYAGNKFKNLIILFKMTQLKFFELLKSIKKESPIDNMIKSSFNILKIHKGYLESCAMLNKQWFY